MTPERHQLITRLYHELSELPAAQRAERLAQVCGGDQGLRAELEDLLATEARLGAFIETPALKLTAEMLAEERAQAAAGEMLAHYRIQALLGAGGMGEVWLAEDTRLGRQAALKLLPPHLTENAERVARLAQEARAASTLNHPNLLTIFELGESQHGLFIAMEHVEGRTLRAVLKERRLELSTILDLSVQIASALAAAHQAGVIHGDIKPENVMQRADGIVKVLDFGLAQLTGRQGHDGEAIENHTGNAPDAASMPAFEMMEALSPTAPIFGTLRYASPEQVRGEILDARSDLYSLGVMLYEMLAGRMPYQDAPPTALLAAILHEEPAPLTEAPPRLSALVTRLLRKEREERYASAAVLLEDLRAMQRELDFQAELARQQRAPAVSARPRHRWAVALASLCVLGVLLGLSIRYGRPAGAADPRGLTLSESDTVLLADFENQTGDPLFDGSLQQALVSQLSQTPFLNLLSDGQKRETLRLMSRKPSEPITAPIAREIGVRRNLKAYLRGVLTARGAAYHLTLEALNPRDGAVLVRAESDADERARVLPALGTAATQLRTRLGESLASLQRFDAPIEQVTTPSLDALKAYVQARDLARSGKFEEPEKLYLHALTLDPNFASAYGGLAVLCYNDDRFDRAREYATRAFQLKDRVSELERLRISQTYYTITEEEIEKSIEVMKLTRDTYPRQLNGYVGLGNVYYKTGRYELAEAVQRAAYQLDRGTFQVFSNLGATLIRLNRFDEAQQIYEEALQRQFDTIDIREDLYILEEIKDDAAGMQRRVADMKGHHRESDVFNWQARTAVIKGQFQRAAEFTRRELEAAGNDQKHRDNILASAANRLSAYGQCASIPATARQLLADKRDQLNVSDAAFWFALCGDTQRATTLLAEEEKFTPQFWHQQYVQRPITRAVIALRRNAPAQALIALEPLQPYERKSQFWAQYLRALVYQRLNQPAAAITELRTALDHRGWSPSSKLWPLLHLELARAYRQQGDVQASRQAYDALLALWKDADADLPQLRAARQEAATLH